LQFDQLTIREHPKNQANNLHAALYQYNATAVPNSIGTAAFFLQLRDSSSEESFINSSNIVELGMPVIRQQQNSE
jgi:hypothetical protein